MRPAGDCSNGHARDIRITSTHWPPGTVDCECTMFDSVDHTVRAFTRAGYFVERDVATTVYLACRMGKPLLVEGEAGCGKTELARALARATGGRFIRLQCYPGIEPREALYEWNTMQQYARITLGIRDASNPIQIEREIYTAPFMIRRPVFDALLDRSPVPPVLLVDAVDRADPSFEAMLAEILDSPTLTIPENGMTVQPGEAVVVLTGNGSRPAGETLRKHSLYAWLGFPPFERELEIVSARVPGISLGLVGQLCNFMEILRQEPFIRRPGIAETIDWAMALHTLRRAALDPALADQTIGCALKHPADIERFRGQRLARRLRPVMDRAG